jgi:cold shock CspA family protein
MGGNIYSRPIPRQSGRVKWFNRASGYGFIEVRTDDSNPKRDIFVHYSSIYANSKGYRYLTKGEEVEFDLAKPERGDHEFHAVNVTVLGKEFIVI